MKRKGFTIIEILVSVALIALLSTMGVTGFQAVSRGGRDALRKTDLEQIRSALEIFKSDYGSYPDSSEECLPDIPPEYINNYPVDPKSDYRYCYNKTSPLTYELCAHLENGNADDLCGGWSACLSNCNYQVTNP
ncbi:MAG: hypothetical protein UV73_C0009G0045 [Candidatus Gottesmanbacteria bacterium GW2011_GWA2_43_14]|uniref:General secretion pathway protein G, general secretion pathway protein G n=1 Tax=Candidatus Gottesmanbacteria bacterium GW2011_GWA2_43_14 TaxID=1618443 RepID=A0A0G1DGA6_9BACT|nr:MAG: hypothetical protein UV73_C0009G0045 [Candidatus Gottesmanbacteria bacterium GW2011_GWA2_43_14]